MTSEPVINTRQLIKERLNNNKCAACDNPAYDEIIENEDGTLDSNSEKVEGCKEHEILNQHLLKTLNIGVKFEDTPQGRYSRTPKRLAAARRWAESELGKKSIAISQAKYEKTENGILNKKNYKNSDKGKQSNKKYEETDSRKLAKARYRNSEKGKEAKQRELETRKAQRIVTKALSRIQRGLCSACDLSLEGCKDIKHQQQNNLFKAIEEGRRA